MYGIFDEYDPEPALWAGVDIDPERENWENQRRQDAIDSGDVDPQTLSYQGTGMRVSF